MTCRPLDAYVEKTHHWLRNPETGYTFIAEWVGAGWVIAANYYTEQEATERGLVYLRPAISPLSKED